MRSITIHNIDNAIDIMIRKKAKKEGKSRNKTIQSLLKKSLGLEAVNEKYRKKDYLDLFGVWNKNDEKEFINNTKMFEEKD